MRLRICSCFAALALSVVVHGSAAAQVTLTSSATAVTFPATVTLTVTVPAGTAASGTALPVTVTNALGATVASSTVTCCLAASVSFPSVALPAGTQVLTANYVPNPATPTPVSSSPLTIVVSPGTPTISWAAPAAIAYGTPLGSAQLDATANVPGTFTYTPPSGTVLAVGVQTLTVAFAPTDSTDYVSTTLSVSITVNKGTPTISWAAPASITYGTPLGPTQLDATANLVGTFTYTPPSGTVLSAGVQTLTVAFAPTDSTDYVSTTLSVSITVNKGTPVISWTTPAPITSGTPLGPAQLDATANVPGTFTYSPPSETVLPVGVQVLTVTFAPTDSTDYVSTTRSVDLAVSAPPPVITFQGPATGAPGQQPTLAFTASSLPSPTTATFSLTFAAGTSPAVDDPSIQFMSGGRTLTVQIPANSTFSQNIVLQTGTVAGAITVTVALTANGTDVTPSSLAPVVIQVPPAVPTINSVTLTRGTGTIQLAIVAYSNTREMVQAEFTFAAAPGQTLQTTDLIVAAGQPFSSWFQSSASAASGGSFLYTQPFTLNGSSSAVGTVSVTLSNTQGVSTAATAQ